MLRAADQDHDGIDIGWIPSLDGLALLLADGREGAPGDGAASDACPGIFDASQIQQLLTNLTINAVHASQPGSTVQVTVRNAADTSRGGNQTWVRVTVADQGAGIREVIRERIFEPFFTTKPSGE